MMGRAVFPAKKKKAVLWDAEGMDTAPADKQPLSVTGQPALVDRYSMQGSVIKLLNKKPSSAFFVTNFATTFFCRCKSYSLELRQHHNILVINPNP